MGTKDLFIDLWQLMKDHKEVWFLTTVASYSVLHYDLYGPPAHLLVLPGLAVAVFFVYPLWSAMWLDSDDKAARAASLFGAVAAMLPCLYWAYAPEGKAMLKADTSPLLIGCVVGLIALAGAGWKSDFDPARWGLGAGRLDWWFRPVAILLGLIVVCIPIVAWLFPEFVEFYPRYKPARISALKLFQYQIAMGVYMFCWEFFFRGYMLFGLERKLGEVPAILLQTFPFYILHHSKPEPELISSWFGGILMGWLCLRAKCMWPSFLLHWVLYSTMEVSAFLLRNGYGP